MINAGKEVKKGIYKVIYSEDGSFFWASATQDGILIKAAHPAMHPLEEIYFFGKAIHMLSEKLFPNFEKTPVFLDMSLFFEKDPEKTHLFYKKFYYYSSEMKPDLGKAQELSYEDLPESIQKLIKEIETLL